MVLHAGAIEVTATDERLAGEAALIRTTGRTALAELRQVLGVLRTSETTGTAPQPLLSDLDTLLAASRAAGVPVTQHLTTTPADPARPAGPVDPAVLAGLAPGVQRTAYRVVQEALTNVHKHAGRAATEVTVDHRPDRLLVTVRNAAPGAPVEPPAAGGLGLAGLRERVALLGGTCRAGTDPDGGFTVHAELPLAPATTLGVGV
jgi:signal transduction histidine kinase